MFGGVGGIFGLALTCTGIGAIIGVPIMGAGVLNVASGVNDLKRYNQKKNIMKIHLIYLIIIYGQMKILKN